MIQYLIITYFINDFKYENEARSRQPGQPVCPYKNTVIFLLIKITTARSHLAGFYVNSD